jgi:hypothetical protein
MKESALRLLIRSSLIDEASASRRSQTRAKIAATGTVPVTSTGRTDIEKQIALTGYNLAKETAGAPPKYGFTMTSIQKVGINPSSGYNTPLGLYAYPVTPDLITQLTGGDFLDLARGIPEIAEELPTYIDDEYGLPFVADAPFINFFRLSATDDVYYTSTGMDDARYRQTVDTLYKWFSENNLAPNPDRAFRAILIQAIRHHDKIGTAPQTKPMPSADMTDYQRLASIWALTRALSLVSAASDFDAAETGRAPPPTQSSASQWRTLLLKVGVKAVVDDAGAGLIHSQEPVQLVVFDTSIIELIQQFDNATRAGKGWDDSGDRRQRDSESFEADVKQSVDGVMRVLIYSKNDTADKDRAFITLADSLNLVNSNAHIRSKFPAAIRKYKLSVPIVDFVLSVMPELQPTTFDGAGATYAYVFYLTGDRRIIEAVTDFLLTKPDSCFADLAKHVELIYTEAGERDVSQYIDALFTSFFARSKDIAAQHGEDAVKMLHALASDPNVQSAMSSDRFIQLALPVIKALPQLGSKTELTDKLRSDLRAPERLKAAGEEQAKIDVLMRKKKTRPETHDLYANVSDLEVLQARLKNVLHVAREELHRLQRLLNDKEMFNRHGNVLIPNEHRLAPGLFIQRAIQSITPDQLQTVESIWTHYVNNIRKAQRGIDILDALTDIFEQRPNLKREDPEYAELLKEKLYEHAQLQITAIHEAIEDLEKEMRAQLDAMDDKGTETSPLYERLITRWL